MAVTLIVAALAFGASIEPSRDALASGEATVTASPTDVEPPNRLSAGRLQDPSRDAEFEGTTDAAPTRLRIPSIGVDTSLESLAVGAAGELIAPVDYGRAGWFAEGVVPGELGPSIIAGHVDSPTGPAVFQRIGELRPGDEVVLELSSGEVARFVITGATQSSKAAFPTSDVYGPVPRSELRLITCAGSFDRGSGHYLDNLVVYAVLA